MNKVLNFSCFSDVKSRKTGSGEYTNTVLDGVRGLAAIIVLLDHCSLLPVGMGRHGVWIFFVLSGYLLTKPLLQKQHPLNDLAAYLGRRVLRIVPMYGIYIGIAALFIKASAFDWFIDHLAFQRSDGHLWSIKQELLFYFLIPPLVWMGVVSRRQRIFVGFALLIGAVLADHYLAKEIFSLSSPLVGKEHRFFVAPFLIGMGSAYLSEHYSARLRIVFCDYQAVITCIAVFYIIAFLLIFGGIEFKAHMVPIATLYAAVIVILDRAYIWPRKSYLGLNSYFLRSIGVVGYSFYLWHWLIRDGVVHLINIPNSVQFLIVLVGTYIVSCVSYALIEKPFINMGKNVFAKNRKFSRRQNKGR